MIKIIKTAPNKACATSLVPRPAPKPELCEIKDNIRCMKGLDQKNDKEKNLANRWGQKVWTWIAKRIGLVSYRGTRSLVLGKGLVDAINNFINEFPNKLTSKTVSELVAHIIWRITRIGIIALLLSLFPIYLLYNQNKLIEVQNLKIDNQNRLMESQRKSTYVLLLDNLIEDIVSELEADFLEDSIRNLSESTINRIISLSQLLKPYPVLSDGAETERLLSPERGFLLMTLMKLGLDFSTSSKIYKAANFHYADMEDAFILNRSFANIRLTGASFRNSILSIPQDYSSFELSDGSYAKRMFEVVFSSEDQLGAPVDFSGSTLVDVCFENAIMPNAIFDNGILMNCDFTGALMNKSRLTIMKDCDFQDAIMNGVKFPGPVEVSNCVVDKDVFDKYFSAGNYKYKKVKTEDNRTLYLIE